MYEELSGYKLKPHLRPGNIIGNFEDAKFAFIVKDFADDVVFTRKIGGINHYNLDHRIANTHLMALPITQSRIIKLGFEDTSLRRWWARGNFQIRYYGVAWEYRCHDKRGFIIAIHELQNTYLTCMGHELTLPFKTDGQ